MSHTGCRGGSTELLSSLLLFTGGVEIKVTVKNSTQKAAQFSTFLYLPWGINYAQIMAFTHKTDGENDQKYAGQGYIDCIGMPNYR